jgi:CRP-like cAMP-binding protein
VRESAPNSIVLEKGTLATELLLLIRGRVSAATGEEVYHPVCILNETAMLARVPQPVTLIATAEDTAFLAIERDWFEERLQVDRDFARGILERESQKRLERSFTR